ncbi:MAG: hypothetical protein Q9220_000361 [cf. Caloplaca sp. 1 TL-2023]
MSTDLSCDFARAQACGDTIGYTFKDPLLLLEALQANGSGRCDALMAERSDRYWQGNMRLAVVGDRILDILLALKWYPTWHVRSEYDLLRINITTNASFNRIGTEHNLDRYIQVAKAQGGIVSPKTMSATIEAIVGAAYLDRGMDAAKMVVRNLGIDVCDTE